MPSNLTIDDYSPLIQYKGQWFDYFNTSINLDPNVEKYSDTSFHSSFTNGSTLSVVIMGTIMYLSTVNRDGGLTDGRDYNRAEPMGFIKS
ncbi:hypothetical protein FRC12_002463, partial [Ceratobasidium sp. 428]